MFGSYAFRQRRPRPAVELMYATGFEEIRECVAFNVAAGVADGWGTRKRLHAHPEKCKLGISTPRELKRDKLGRPNEGRTPEPGSAECVSAFLGEHNWPLATVSVERARPRITDLKRAMLWFATICGNGGTGRRSRLRTCRAQALGGSNPSSRTTQNQRLFLCTKLCPVSPRGATAHSLCDMSRIT